MNGLLCLEEFGSNLYTVDTPTGTTNLVGNSSGTLQFAAFAAGITACLRWDTTLISIPLTPPPLRLQE